VAVHTKKDVGTGLANRTSHYPIILEHEANGTVSAYVVGLLTMTDTPRPLRASLRVARITYRNRAEPEVGLVGLGALRGRKRSARRQPPRGRMDARADGHDEALVHDFAGRPAG
jgi:hypothetical protein